MLYGRIGAENAEGGSDVREACATIGKRLLGVLLAGALLLSLLPFGMAQERSEPTDGQENTADAQEDEAMDALNLVCEQLMAAGFPRSYAERLAPLQLTHPSRRFEALFVPEDWSYVLSMEVDDNPARNLISAGAAYTGYRHLTNTALYDTGWYQASRETVKYFMDPRNFFNETDIFQFYRFSGVEADGADMTVAVESVLRDTFMQDTVLENGKTYAENFIEIGNALELSPLYLAVKARQEQGVYGGFTSTGDAGQLLTAWLAAGEQGSAGHDAAALATLDGYYNIFNINASGTGKFRVLYGAMQRAIEGTPTMAESWGGAAWDTVWKSIYGGAETVKTRYTGNDQDTLYLQKFNVSPEANRRFWGQYMQNVMGALSEGRSLFYAFDAAGAVNGACVFRIPVYTGMEEQPNGDPCGGSSPYGSVATASLQWQGRIAAGESVAAIDGDAVSLLTSAAADGSSALSGSVWANVPVTEVTASLVMKNGTLQSDAAARTVLCRGEGTSASFLTLIELPEGTVQGDRLVYSVDARFDVAESYRCKTVTLAYVTIDATAPETVAVTVCDGTQQKSETVAAGTSYLLPDAAAEASDEVFVGWLVSGAVTDGLYPAKATVVLGTSAVSLEAVRLQLRTLPGAAFCRTEAGAALRFDGAIGYEAYESLCTMAEAVPMMLIARGEGEPDNESGVILSREALKRSAGEQYWVMSGMTEEILPQERETAWSAVAALRVRYADGSEQVLTAAFDAAQNTRGAHAVARAALADDTADYGEELRSALEPFAE